MSGGSVSPIARVGLRHVFIRDLVMRCSIGVHAHEERAKQRVRVNLDLSVHEDDAPLNDRLASVVCYDAILKGVRAIIDEGHVRLIETLAERLAAVCLNDPRVRSVHVQVEKLDVYDDVTSVGVVIERARNSTNHP